MRPLLEDTPSTRMFGGALGFLKAARLLFEDNPGKPLFAQCFVNIGLATELACKAFLLARGETRAGVKGIGHDLNKMMLKCVERGYAASTPALAAYISELSPSYRDMSLRYMEGEPVVHLPGIGPMIGAVTQLTHELMRQSRLYDHVVGARDR